MKYQSENQVKQAIIENKRPKMDLKKRAYLYALKIIEFIDRLQRNDSVSRIIGDQLIRSGTSIAANIIEAQSASSKKDFINYYNHSLKSANESILWIRLLSDSHRIEEQESENILQETNEIANILAASILTMKGKRKF